MNKEENRKENRWFAIRVILLLIFGLLANLIIEAQNEDWIQPPFEGYYKLYKTRLNKAGIELPVDYVAIRYNTNLKYTPYLGVARGMWMPTVVNVIISERWNTYPMAARMWVIFHELTHDIFNIEHGEIDLMQAGLPEWLESWDVDEAMDQLVRFLKKDYDWDRVKEDRSALGQMTK
jgi:hypothetical protein